MTVRQFSFQLVLGAFVTLGNAASAVGNSMQTSGEQPRTLVILGASYAQGWGTPLLAGYDRVINRGVGGEETGDMLARLPADVLAAKPHAVLVWGHVNNITRAAPDGIEAAKSAARGHYDQMLRQARAAGIDVIFATEVPWTEESGFINTVYGWLAGLMGKTSYAVRVSGHVEDVNAHLRALAAREGLRLLDFGKAFANEDGTRRQEFAAEDGSHINEAGYRALTEYANRELRKTK